VQTFADGLASEGEVPLVLTRGWWLGAQKYGAVLWSSDIQSTFSELKAQVPEGIAAAMSGVPWWTTDVG
jgi:alpha-D-xyloside xylohydrolase